MANSKTLAKDGVWTTESELRWVDDLGEYIPKKFRPGVKVNRRDLLKRYLASMPCRDNWGDIEPVVVALYIVQILHPKKHKGAEYA